jgi:hypothetical protein
VLPLAWINSHSRLVNALQHVNREQESVEVNPQVQAQLAKTKEARKKVVRYTQLIDNDPEGDFLGTLLSTNEQILAALALYDRWCKPPEHDSEDEADDVALAATAKGKAPASVPDVDLLAQRTTRISLTRRDTELDKLQDRQRAEVERVNRARAGQPHPDLQDLAFGSNASSSAHLQPPLEPRHASDSDHSSEFSDGLSDYSSEDERRPSTHASAGTHRPYAQHAQADDDDDGRHGLLDASDPFADPFADGEDEVVTPGIHERKEWCVASLRSDRSAHCFDRRVV